MTVTKPDAADNSRRSANSLQARNTHATDFGSFCRINRKQKQRLNITGRARLPPSRTSVFSFQCSVIAKSPREGDNTNTQNAQISALFRVIPRPSFPAEPDAPTPWEGEAPAEPDVSVQ
jgi:hypothetical protein